MGSAITDTNTAIDERFVSPAEEGLMPFTVNRVMRPAGSSDMANRRITDARIWIGVYADSNTR